MSSAIFGVALFFAAFCSIKAWEPSLSDNVGLNGPSEPLKFGTVENYVTGSVWPKPQSEKRVDTFFSLDPGHFMFSAVGQQSSVLSAAMVRYKTLTFPDMVVPVEKTMKMVETLQIKVVDAFQPLALESDESYTLDIQSPNSMLTATTVWGALKGLETFSQVVHQNESGSYFVQMNHINDFPRFHHRGFMIDTSRHYVAVPIILDFIDAMSYSKFNVLHWHIVDNQAFPFVSKTFPSLHGQGARNNRTSIYNAADVQTIIRYAGARGIRVMPEFDTPGHTGSWFSIKDLLTKCYQGGKPNGQLGPIDPTIDANYDFLKKFFTEVSETFPDHYIHLGGDEVSFWCWQSNPNIAKWMQSHSMGKNYSLLEQYYEQKLLDIVGALKKGYIIWQEVVDNQVKVKSDTIVNVWKGGWQAEMAKVTGLGHRAILSSCWYLNYISYGPDWVNYYKCDPQDFTGTTAQKNLVIGGTGCMWGEWVDGTNLIARTWGRALAVGERLWSNQNVKDQNEATKRMWEHRCRYLRRGIQAENVAQSQYCRHEWKNPKDHK
eukprot:gene16574-18259_t